LAIDPRPVAVALFRQKRPSEPPRQDVNLGEFGGIAATQILTKKIEKQYTQM